MEVKVAASMRVALIMVVVEAAAMLLTAAAAPAAAETYPRACTRSCGNISIPYPFGIEPSCYYAAGFNLTCKHHPHRPPELLLGDGTVQVLEVSVPNATVRINSVVVKFPGGADTHTHGTWGGALGEGGPYYLAEMRNKLVASGCNVQLLLTGDGNQTVSACSAFCNEDRDGGAVIYVAGHCSGVGCCQAEILVGRSSYGFQVMGMNGAGAAAESNGWACIVESELNTDPDQLAMVSPSTLPAVLRWRINDTTCHRNKSSHACRSSHSFCEDIATEYATIGREEGHLCRCAQGYEGNPYVPNGCHDVDECRSPGACYGDCTNTEGGYQCRCPPGFEGNASIPNGCKDIDECAHRDIYPCYGICINMPGTFHCQCSSGTSGNPLTKGGCKASFPVLTIGLGVSGGIGLLLLAIATPFILRKIKLQKARRMKQRFFKQNQGLLLQQLISQKADIGGRVIVTLEELEKATNNFDASHKVGGGGHGVVYKGLLNLQVVAIKKSKIIVQREIDEFINEVVILSQINHRNVVKLLGCCLETEVPLLVYEFISNGTLAHHLHVEGLKSLSWDDRLRIALEISRALAYLHSAASTPILHRDIKSSNILLDDNLTAKVSDFGASKYIQIDQTGVTTVIQGTIGYLDPMYYYTCRLTDKSDVFSFGVLLVELLTRKKPFVYRTSDGESLVSHFASLLAEGRLVEIIDPQIIEEKGEHVDEIATLAEMCTKLDGEGRPTMRNVEMTLERLRVTKMQVHHNITSRRKYEKDRTASHYMSLGGLTVETSRQYTMEEEILLSARYPR